MVWSTNKWLKSTLPSLSIHLFSLWIFNIIPPGCRPLCLYLWCVQLGSDSLISQCCSPPAQSCYTLSFSGYRVNMKGVLRYYEQACLWFSFVISHLMIDLRKYWISKYLKEWPGLHSFHLTHLFVASLKHSNNTVKSNMHLNTNVTTKSSLRIKCYCISPSLLSNHPVLDIGQWEAVAVSYWPMRGLGVAPQPD